MGPSKESDQNPFDERKQEPVQRSIVEHLQTYQEWDWIVTTKNELMQVGAGDKIEAGEILRHATPEEVQAGKVMEQPEGPARLYVKVFYNGRRETGYVDLYDSKTRRCRVRLPQCNNAVVFITAKKQANSKSESIKKAFYGRGNKTRVVHPKKKSKRPNPSRNKPEENN